MKFILSLLLVFNFVSMQLSFSQLQEIRMLSIPKKPEMELLPQDEIRSNWSDFKFERTEKEYNHLKVENYAIIAIQKISKIQNRKQTNPHNQMEKRKKKQFL